MYTFVTMYTFVRMYTLVRKHTFVHMHARIQITWAWQAHEAGRRLKEMVGDGGVFVYHSPYIRTTQTAYHIVGALDENQVCLNAA